MYIEFHRCHTILVFFFYQRTPLHIATENGYTYTVEALAAKKADISAKDNAGVSVHGFEFLIPMHPRKGPCLHH